MMLRLFEGVFGLLVGKVPPRKRAKLRREFRLLLKDLTEALAAGATRGLTSAWLVGLLLLSGTVEARDYPATVRRVVDGDTLVVSVDLGFGVRMERPARLARINAWETRGWEKTRGEAARGWLASQVEGRAVTLRTGRREFDKYGRLLVEVWQQGACVNDTLVTLGHARTYLEEDW